MTDSGFIVAAGLLVYVAFAVLQCVFLQPEPYYSVYDSDNWAKARWFLLKRLGLAPGQSRTFTPGADFSIFNSTAISNVPGGYNRWRLPQDTSGKCYSTLLLDVALFQTGSVKPVWSGDICTSDTWWYICKTPKSNAVKIFACWCHFLGISTSGLKLGLYTNTG